MNRKRDLVIDQSLVRLGKDIEQKRIDSTFIENVANEELGIAYTIKDTYLEDLHIKKSANGWWMNVSKVTVLISAFKCGHDIVTACVYAGVSRSQWQYFMKLHPEFTAIIEMCRQHQIVRATDTIIANLDDPQIAKWYLERTHPRFKTKLTLEDIQGQQLPSMSTNLGAYENGDVKEIAKKLIQTAETMLNESGMKKEEILSGEISTTESHASMVRNTIFLD